MRKKNYKGRCEKVSLSKCQGICKTYDPIQMAYANMLQNDDAVSEFWCNVVLDTEEYTTDFLCTKVGGEQMVRECVQRSHLTKPMTVQKNFPKVLNVLKNATTVKEASDIVLMDFECPQNAESHKIKRASFGQKYYTQFATNPTKGVGNVGYLYFTKGQSEKVSEHFNSIEFDCHGAGCCSQTIVNERLQANWQRKIPKD